MWIGGFIFSGDIWKLKGKGAGFTTYIWILLSLLLLLLSLVVIVHAIARAMQSNRLKSHKAEI